MFKLSTTMVIDFAGCWLVEIICKALFADLAPKPIVLRGKERREKRRAEEEKAAAAAAALAVTNGEEKKNQ